jgi:radical SAM protein with 4Fe4S-binding SPASM domain
MHISTCFGSKEQYERLYDVDRYDKVVDNVLDILRCNKEMGYPVDIHLNLRQDKPYEPFFSSDLYSELVDLIDDLEKIVILDDLWDNFRGIINLEGLPKGHQFKKQFEEKPLPCYALYRKVEVLYDGTIQACACRVEPELWVGNILDFDSLEEVWRSPGLEKLREDWFDGKIKNCCQTCSHYVPYTTLVDKGTFRVVGKKVVGKILRVIGVR